MQHVFYFTYFNVCTGTDPDTDSDTYTYAHVHIHTCTHTHITSCDKQMGLGSVTS